MANKKKQKTGQTIPEMLARVGRGEISAEKAKMVLISTCNLTLPDSGESCLGESLLLSMIRAEV